MKRFVLSFALAVGLLASASTLQAQVNMSRYITLTVTNGAAIKLDFYAAAAATPVRIVSGTNTQDITVGTDWLGEATYTAGSTTMTVYGDIIGFDCSDNGANITAIDVSHNTQLKELSCYSNSLSNLDVSNNTQLTYLDCSSNPLSSLDVSKNTQLTELYCWGNNLSSLDLSTNTQLTELYCYENKLNSLDVSGCTQLDILNCYDNKLSSLDVSGCTQLTELRCSKNRLSKLDISKNTQLTYLNCSGNNLSNLDLSQNTQLTELYCGSNNLSSLDVSGCTQLSTLLCCDNNFTTAALDDIFCALPDRTGKGYGVIQPVYSDTSSNHATVLATNKQNATTKNWRVQYYRNNADIATTGTYVCGTVHLDT